MRTALLAQSTNNTLCLTGQPFQKEAQWNTRQWLTARKEVFFSTKKNAHTQWWNLFSGKSLTFALNFSRLPQEPLTEALDLPKDKSQSVTQHMFTRTKRVQPAGSMYACAKCEWTPTERECFPHTQAEKYQFWVRMTLPRWRPSSSNEGMGPCSVHLTQLGLRAGINPGQNWDMAGWPQRCNLSRQVSRGPQRYPAPLPTPTQRK